MALADTGATYTFITEDKSMEVRIEHSPWGGLLKMVNAIAKLLASVGHGVKLWLGLWHGHVDLLVALMDDFKLVLDFDFLRLMQF